MPPMNSNLLQSFVLLIHFKFQPSSGKTRLFQTDFMCRIEERCDQISHCKDKSDENNCKLIVFEDNYNSKVPPFTVNKDMSVEAVKVNVSTSLMNILAISEFDHTIHFKLGNHPQVVREQGPLPQPESERGSQYSYRCRGNNSNKTLYH